MRAANGGGLLECSTKVIWAQLSGLKAPLLLVAIKFTLSLLVSGATGRIRHSEWKCRLIIVYDKQTILIQVFLITYAVITHRHNGRKWSCSSATLMRGKVLTVIANSVGMSLICRSYSMLYMCDTGADKEMMLRGSEASATCCRARL